MPYIPAVWSRKTLAKHCTAKFSTTVTKAFSVRWDKGNHKNFEHLEAQGLFPATRYGRVLHFGHLRT